MSAYFSGYFNKGEINTPTIVHSAKQFKNLFGTATDENYNDWYQAHNYLQYSPNLIVTRSVEDATNSYSGYPLAEDVPVVINGYEDWLLKYDNLIILPENSMKFIAKTPGDWANGIQIAIITLLEWEANYIIYDNVRAKDMIKFMQPSEYAIFIIRNGLIVETFVKSYDAWEDLNIESLYIYVKANVENPAGYHDGNLLMFDGNGLLIDGNVLYEYVPVAYGEGIINLGWGEQTPPLEQDIIDSYALVESKETYQFNYVIANERYNLAAKTLAESRKDCVAFVGTPNIPIGDVISYRTDLGDSMYTTIIAEYKKQLDPFSNTYKWINIAGDACGLKAQSDNDHDDWFAGAGLSRGMIQNVADVKYKPSKKLQGTWYKESINSVAFQAGYYLSGQKTMMYRAVSYNRVNVRALFNKLERDIGKIARNGVFDTNDVYTRNRISATIKPYLVDIKAGRGIYNYKIICDDTNNPDQIIQENKLIIDIIVQPTVVAEFIRLRFTNTGEGTVISILTRA